MQSRLQGLKLTPQFNGGTERTDARAWLKERSEYLRVVDGKEVWILH
jgi:hypothetical protein